MKLIVLLSCLLLLSTTTLGCSPSKIIESSAKPAESVHRSSLTTTDVNSTTTSTNSEIHFIDSKGQEVVLKQKPQRVILLNTEIQELYYQLGGKAVGLATAPGIPMPEAGKDAAKVGQINQVSMEQIMNLKPDLVIGQSFFHASLKESFDASKIPVALIDIKSYEDIRKTAEFIGQLMGKEAETKAALTQTDQKMQRIIEKLPAENPKYAMITIMPMGISVQKNSTISLDAANRLKLKNVADSMASGMMPSSAPYSLEKLVELDPDYVFFIVHGTEEYGKEKLNSEIANNPAWRTLRAVKENKIYFLPSQLFVANPGLNFDQSLSYLASLVYPDVVGNVQK
ncbi:ABC transporter substrate-binding protein [Paenibacillus sp. SYP-B3998]|uniref:ABC transporter substrate-binding protein n=1 Tax=Paenibacillus sp. SYP-B3998 TaxID=2678564 RepID=A0A6G3ZUD8_9BACL|nr:ABC transporter substrate-binding protein [Paenibacillus sp. SYP-B3998]NEW05680.1 ABC transporter substrate-binding protein [Paenibacillus sp. SYP-B3998]